MPTLAAFVRRFDTLNAQDKARWIAGVCAILGILMGFVFYIVLTHTFEQSNFGPRLIALVVGLVLAIAVARLAEWLSETIDTGEAELGKALARAVPTAIILLLVFELCVSTFDEFVKSTIGDFATVRELAARVAGQAGDRASFSEGDARLAAFRSTLAKTIATKGTPAASTAEGRLLQLMQLRYRVPAFYSELRPSDDDVSMLGVALAIAFPRRPLAALATGALPDWVRACRAQSPLVPSIAPSEASSVWASFSAFTQSREAQISACREGLSKMTDNERNAAFVDGVNAELRLHDLYDAQAFPGRTEGHVVTELAAQRALCDEIRASQAEKGLHPATCLQAVVGDAAVAAAHPGLLPRDKLMPLNRELLARVMPKTFTPPPIYWLDLFFLVAMWCTAAVALSRFLCDSVFAIAPSASLLEAWKTSGVNALTALFLAPIVAGAILVAARLVLYVIALMFDTESVAPTEMWSGVAVVLQSVPLAVSWLYHGGIFGISIPGWISVPLVFLALLGIAGASKDEGMGTLATWAIFGVVLCGIGPVLNGIVLVMFLIWVTWLVPAFGLATLLPYLEPGTRVPRWWAYIAIAAAVTLAGWSLLRWWDVLFGDARETLAPTVLAAAAFSLGATSIFILRERPIRDLWPLVAVTVAFCLIGGAIGVQQATFYGVVRAVTSVTAPAAGEAARQKSPAQPAGIFTYLIEGTPSTEPDVAPSKDLERAEVLEGAHLELALVGSLGFWLTIALLAAWSLRQHEDARHRGSEAAPVTAPAT